MASKEEPVNNQGYPLTLFLGEIPDKYKCVYCHKVAREIHMTECCRRQVCLSCINPYYLNNQPCPHCQEKDFSIMPLKKDNKKIANLGVNCREKEKGCEWIGKLKELDDHLHKEEDGCEYSPRECPKCRSLVDRCKMANHLKESCLNRDYNCPHCGYQSTYDFVTRAHKPDCSNWPVPCPNQGCAVTCERNVMDYHKREGCQEQFIDCDYKHAGCDVKYRRKNKDEHMKLYQEKHQTMYQVHTLKMTEKLQEMLRFQEKHNQTMEESERRAQELEEKVTNLEQTVTALTQENQQEIKKLSQRVEELERKLQDQERRFDQQIQQLKIEFNHQDQSDQPDPTYAAKPKQQKAKPISSSPPQQLNIAKPCVFTINKFAERKANKEKWESPVMMTPNGYKLLLEVWPSGKYEGEDTHISVWVQYIREEVEEETKWPARVTMNLELLRQKKAPQNTRKVILMESFDIQCDHYSKKRQYNFIGKFSNTLISHKALEENQLFLKNDSLKMQVTLLSEQVIPPSYNINA